MENFEWSSPTKMVFGKGQIAKLKDHIPVGKKVMLVAGGGSVKKNGVYDQVIAAYPNFVCEFWGIEPNPKYETAMKAVELAKKKDIDYILAVGGGSVIDATKWICMAVLYDNSDDPYDMVEKWGMGGGDIKYKATKALPFGCVLTIPATGSETNSGGVLGRISTKQKLPFGNELVFPQFAICDPSVTFSLPKRQVTNGLVDAYVHVVEQYFGHYGKAPLQDRQAEALCLTLMEVGEKTVTDLEDYNSRANFEWCATLALNWHLSTGVGGDWSAHWIGHEMTALYGLDHGVTLAIILPAIMKWQIAHAPPEENHMVKKYRQYAERVFGVTDPKLQLQAAVDKTREWFESIGMKTSFKGHGADDSHFGELAARFKGKKSGSLGNLNEPEVLEILKLAL